MANTHWEDRTSEEIVSSHISGLQDAVKNIEQSLDMDTEAVSEESLTLLADASGSYRIAEAVGKRNWLNDPAPVVEQYIVDTWTTISAGFTIDYAGGAIIFTEDKVGEQFRASFTRVKNTSGFQGHLLKKASQSQLGHVIVDDTTIIASSGVITAKPVQSIGGWTGAVLDGCELSGSEMELSDGEIADSRITDDSVAEIYDVSWVAGKFVADGNASVVDVTSKLLKVGSPTEDLQVHIYSESGGNPNASLGSANVTAASLGTDIAGTEVTVTITPSSALVDGTTYFVVWRTGTVLANRYRARLRNVGSGGNRYSSTTSGSSWTAEATQIMWFYVETKITTGTFYIDHTPPNLIDYCNIFFNKFIPAVPGTQTVTLAVKDTSDNVLIADVQDNASLSSIDPMTYPTIRIHGTLTRADAGDESPSVGTPLISYIGTPAGGE